MNRIDMQIMRSRILLIAFSLTLAAGLQAQQDPMYSMYMWNMMTLNPGYAGSNDVLNVTALSRVQWASINGAPVTHSLSAHAPVNRRSLGLGGSVVNDHIGRSNTLSAFADVSYRIRLSHTTRLAFGLKAGEVGIEVRHRVVGERRRPGLVSHGGDSSPDTAFLVRHID
ncbi:MAG: PorP/SprF family type IX secretion system membrane protein, partial [Flavobacteriales bacterium]